MAFPTAAAGEASPVLSACFTAIQKSPLASAMTIAAPTHCPSACRIPDLKIMVHHLILRTLVTAA